MKRKSKQKKKKMFLTIIILITIIIISIIIAILYSKKNALKITLINNLNIEINTKIKLFDFIENIHNGEILTENKEIDTSKLGIKNIEFLVKNKFNKEEKYSFNINIIDTTKPVISGIKEITSYINKEINLLENITVDDNSKEELPIKIEGTYDIHKIGEYSLNYTATDSSNNKTTEEFKLRIINDPNNYTFKTSKGYTANVINGVTYIDGILIANKTYSLPSNFGSGLTKETQNAFNQMKVDSTTLGLNIYISSGYRSYYDQRYIYNNYVARDGKDVADTYSARAGHSEHQTGLSFDLNSIDDSFTNTPEGLWIHDNCYKYGFILRYPKDKDNITGYMHESWHLRYVGIDLATKLYNNGNWITLEEHFGIDSKYS